MLKLIQAVTLLLLPTWPYSSLLMEGTNRLELKVEVAAGWDWRV